LVELQRTVYPHKWSPVNCRSSAGEGKFDGERPAFYDCATQSVSVGRPVRLLSVDDDDDIDGEDAATHTADDTR